VTGLVVHYGHPFVDPVGEGVDDGGEPLTIVNTLVQMNSSNRTSGNLCTLLVL
jgi:hypothetical protein